MVFLIFLAIVALLLMSPVGRYVLLVGAIGFGVLFYYTFYVQLFPAQQARWAQQAATQTRLENPYGIDWTKPPYNGHAVTAPAPAKTQALPPAAVAAPPASPAGSVEDMPWDPDSPELGEPSAASQRLLHRLHKAQGLPG
jgi:hypothetical protein